MIRKVISLDADDIIWDCVGALCNWHNDYVGTTLQREDFDSYDLAEVIARQSTDPDRIQIAIERVGTFTHSRYFVDMPLIPGARETILALAENHDIILTTSRDRRLLDVTWHQCKRDLNGAIKEVHISHNAYTGWAGKTKGQICAEKRVIAHWDDSPKYIENCISYGVPCGMLDAPWNRSHKGAVRALNWHDISRNPIPSLTA